MRILIDTHIFIWYSKVQSNLSRDVYAMLQDFEKEICISGESVRELIALWNHKQYIKNWWKSPVDIINSIVDDCNFTILYLKKEHYDTYARLQINVADNHFDPSDHLIISHAICNHIPLISDDAKFKFYRNQGLQLIENE